MPGERAPDELSATLQRLRRSAGLSLRAVGERAGVSASTAQRLERGAYLPTPEQAEALARAVGATAAERRRVVQLAADLQTRVSPRQVLVRGAVKAQRKYAEIDKASGHVRSFSPVAVTGALQIPDYMRVVFGRLPVGDVERAVAERAPRAAALAADGPPRYTQVMTEGALRWCVGSPALMAAQCDHIADIARDRPGAARVGIIPWWRPVGVFPMHSFDVYDERAVIFGTRTGTAYVAAPPDVTGFVALYGELAELADFDEAAAGHAQRIADDYRTRA